MIRWLVLAFWRAVWSWKHRTGFLDLGADVVATGTVIRVDPPGTDGDGNFDLRLDTPDQDWLITAIGGRLTSCPPVTEPALHCEVEPWAPAGLRRTCAALRVGERVRVSGRWGFDGVHTGRSMLLEILLALLRHQPNVRDGWCELHPVTGIEILGRDETA